MIPSAAAPSTAAKTAPAAAVTPATAAPGNLQDPLASHPSAHAYTQGADMAFPGSAGADSAAGKQLLAHELTHTVQQ